MGDNKYINIMSKVSERTHARLTKICKLYHFRSNYEILQYLISAFLRYADPGGEDAEGRQEAEDIRQLFADLDNVERRVITARPTLESKDLSWAICGYNIGRKKNALARCIQYRPDGVTTTDRYDAPLKTVIGAMYPRAAVRMDKAIKSRHLASNYEDLLLRLLDKLEDSDDISDEVQGMFAGYAEGQERVEPGKKPKQHRDHAKRPSVS